MSRVDWNNVSKEIKEQMLYDIYDVLESPCGYEGYDCPFNKYKLDCDKDNDNHCLVRDFVKSCLDVK